MALPQEANASMPVWIDCDPGHDDLFALVLALAAHIESKIQLLGISTVAGNQPLETATVNAQTLLALAGFSNIPICRGQAKPLLRPPVPAEVQSFSTVTWTLPQGFQLPSLVEQKGVVYMHQAISRSERPVRLVALACLTNIALLLTLYPAIKSKIEKIIILGGAWDGPGNVTPTAEFNIWVDPHAARIVFEAGVDIVLIPLQVTHTVRVTPSLFNEIEEKCRASTFGTNIAGLFHQYRECYRKLCNFEAPPYHDPLAVAYAISPSLFKTSHMRVDVETLSEMTIGQTVVDVWETSGRPKNVHLAMNVQDLEAFWKLMISAIECVQAYATRTS